MAKGLPRRGTFLNHYCSFILLLLVFAVSLSLFFKLNLFWLSLRSSTLHGVAEVWTLLAAVGGATDSLLQTLPRISHYFLGAEQLNI